MKYLLSVLSLISILGLLYSSNAQEELITPFEKSEGQKSTTYRECIDFYYQLAQHYEAIQIEEFGMTDSGYPLHIVTYNKGNGLKPMDSTKIKYLILNGIHPGEPAGIDASMMLLRDLASGAILPEVSENIFLSLIPIYNIGGALNRSAFSRANQNGPDEYGFRGNAKNLDLNRDFIKMDSRNTQSFVLWFHRFDPDIFVDTHTSNGADYQYIMTCLETHPQKLGGLLGQFQKLTITPSLSVAMKERGYEMCPFVNIYGSPPDNGYEQFLDYPRYSTGFAAMFQTIGYMSEAHMLKSFKKRVDATYAFLLSLIETGYTYRKDIKSKKEQDRQDIQKGDPYFISWATDKSVPDSILFKGYKYSYLKSSVTGERHLYYDLNRPYEIKIPYYNRLLSRKTIYKPQAYIIPQAMDKAIDNLKANNIIFTRFPKDTLLNVEFYYIKEFSTYQSPFEGHYQHYNTVVYPMHDTVLLRKGDYFVSVSQPGVRYLIESLEPEAVDSFFNWNLFDAILQQKEHFSDYVFEETAKRLLMENSWLRDSLEIKKQTDVSFRSNSWAQLNYIYKHSAYFEKSYRRYPVYRMTK